MHEAKLHRAKYLRLQRSENSFPTARSASFFDAMEAWKRTFSMLLRRPESSKRVFSMIFRRQEASERACSSIFRRQEASERSYSSIFDVWRLRSEHFRAFSTSGGSAARIFESSSYNSRPQSSQVPNPLSRHCKND